MNAPQPPTKRWTPNPDPSSIVVPGVDATSSVNNQIDQIDQLITIRLQNIDANFSRIQHIISTKLLPAFKRFAEGTEPAREAAKFWKSFYEAAAQVRIPITNDTTSPYPAEDESSQQDTTLESADEDGNMTPKVNPPDDSFARGAPVSSTPLVRDPTSVGPPGTAVDDSWAASIESPFERLGRQVREFSLEKDVSTPFEPSLPLMHDPNTANPPHSITHRPTNPPAPAEPTPQAPSHHRPRSPHRHKAPVATTSSTISTPPQQLHALHRKKTPKNPFLHPGSGSRHWNGLVDLRHPSPGKLKAGSRVMDDGNGSDSSDDLFPAGMSPPVTMQFVMPYPQKSTTKLTLTPARKAAERIRHDLVANAAARGIDGGKFAGAAQRAKNDPSISSVAPSLPSLSRYREHPPSMRPFATKPASEASRAQNDSVATPNHQIYPQYSALETFTQPSDPPKRFEQHGGQNIGAHDLITNEGSMNSPGSDSDSASSEHDESNPSAAFLLAAQNNARSRSNDSQHSMSSDEDEDAVQAVRPALAHMFIEDATVDDSFERDDTYMNRPGEEETVFGARQVGKAPGESRLRIMRDALLDDTNPGAPSLNPYAQVEQTPTPYNGNSGVLR